MLKVLEVTCESWTEGWGEWAPSVRASDVTSLGTQLLTSLPLGLSFHW